MDLVIFNASLYVCAMLLYWSIRRKIDAGLVLLSVYAIISIICVFNYAASPNLWNLQLWPFLYLFVISMLSFRPYFFDSDILQSKLYVPNKNILKVFASFYVICAIIAIYYSLGNAIENINTGEWAILRNQLYQGDVELYKSQLERIAKNFSGYLRPLAIVIFFYYLTQKKVNPIWMIIMALAIILPSFIMSINIASRGLLINLAVSLFIGYLIFRRKVPSHLKRIVNLSAFILLALFLIYSLAVTVSRFGDDDQGASLLSYFGHSMLTFNFGIADSIHTYMNGEYFFGWFYDKFGLAEYGSVKHIELGTHFGTAFNTFVGAWYLDFGPILTILIAIIFPFLISLSFRYKKRLDIADIYMFSFYADYLIMGVFVIGRGNALAWLVALIIYITFKIIK